MPAPVLVTPYRNECHQPPIRATAQKYRVETDDKSFIRIRDCDASGTLVLYISKMVPTSDKGRLYLVGRVFFGAVRAGPKYRIRGPNDISGKKDDPFVELVQHSVLMMYIHTLSASTFSPASSQHPRVLRPNASGCVA